MKKKLSLLLVLCFVICSFSVNVNAVDSENEEATQETLQYVPNEVVVTTNVYYDVNDYSGAESYQFNGVTITDIEPLFFESTEEEIAARIEKLGYDFSYAITLDTSWGVLDAIDVLATSQYVTIAEPNYNLIDYTNCGYEQISESIMTSINASTVDSSEDSTETGAVEQWAHDYLNIESVWSSSFIGSDDVIVAVLDGKGFVQTSDLEDNLDMSLAYDATAKNNDVAPDSMDESYSHGNAIAGIIGADYNDGGVNGICKNVRIIPVQLSDSGANIVNMLAGCEYAIYNGADIICLSYGISQLSEQLDKMIERIELAGALLIGPSGDNGGVAIETVGAATGWRNDSPNVIVVGTMSQDGTKYANSNYSPTYVDLFAPGVSIESTGLNGNVTCQGSSYAVPHFAAACALIMSRATHLTPLEVKNLLFENVTVVEGLDEYCVTGGVLSITNAINSLYADENRGVYSKGDISGDGDIAAVDYLMCKRIVMGELDSTDEQYNAADVNFDGDVSIVDYLLIQRFINGQYYFPPY